MATGKTNAAGGRGFKYGEKIVVSEATANTFIKHGYGQRRINLTGKMADKDFRGNYHMCGYFPIVGALCVVHNKSIVLLDPDNFSVRNSISAPNGISYRDYKRGRLFGYHNNHFGFFDLNTKNFVPLSTDNGLIFDNKYLYSLKYDSSRNEFTLKVFDIETPSRLIYIKSFKQPKEANGIGKCISFNVDTKIATFISRNGVTRINVETLEIVSEQGKDVYGSMDFHQFSSTLNLALLSANKYESYYRQAYYYAILYNVETENIEKTYSVSVSKEDGNEEYGSMTPFLLSDDVILVYSSVGRRYSYTYRRYIYHNLDNILIDKDITNTTSNGDKRYLVETYNNDYREIAVQYAYVKDKRLYYLQGENYGTSLQLTNILTWYEQ